MCLELPRSCSALQEGVDPQMCLELPRRYSALQEGVNPQMCLELPRRCSALQEGFDSQMCLELPRRYSALQGGVASTQQQQQLQPQAQPSAPNIWSNTSASSLPKPKGSEGVGDASLPLAEDQEVPGATHYADALGSGVDVRVDAVCTCVCIHVHAVYLCTCVYVDAVYTCVSIHRVGQNHIYMVYVRYFWQENCQIYGIHLYNIA